MTATIESPRRELGTARLTFGGILRSEGVKLLTLRSTWWCLSIVAVLTAGIPALVSLAFDEGPRGLQAADIGLTLWMSATTLPSGFSVLAVAVLGCLVITGEYGTGMIRSTMAAVPKRMPALGAKALVIGAVAFATVLLALVIGAALSGLVLGAKGYVIDAGDPRVWSTLAAAAGYPALLAMFSVGVGTIIRNSAGAIASVLGLLLVVPTILQIAGSLLNATWIFDVAAFLPDMLGAAMTTPPVDLGSMPSQGTLELRPGPAALVFAAWTAAALGGGALLLRRRDV